MANSSHLATAHRTVISYVIFSTLWVLLSDSVLFLFLNDQSMMERYSMVKGLAFVLVSSLLLYFIITSSVRRQKETLSQLRFSESQYQGIVNTAFDAVVSVDERFTIVQFNPAAEKIFGYSSDEIEGEPLEKILPHRLQDLPVTGLSGNAVSDQIVRTMGSMDDMVGVRMTGERFPIEASISKLPYADRTMYTVVLRDITERIKAERSLQESEERLRMLIDGVRDHAIIMLDTNGCIISWNNGARLVTGFSTQESIGKHFAIVLTGGGIGGLSANEFLRLAGEQGFIEKEGTCIRKDGAIITAEIGMTALFSSDGALKGYSMIIRDITARKRDEERLMKEKQFTDSLLETLPGVFYYYDQNGKFLRWNQNLEKVTGYTSAEIAAMNPLDFFSEPDKIVLRDRISKVFSRGFSDAEAYFIAKDGTKHPYYFTGKRIRVGEHDHLIGVGVDISDRMKAEAELGEAQKKLYTTLENMTDAFVSLDTNWRYTFMNQSAGKIFARNPAEMIGKHIWTEFPEGVGQPFHQAYERAMRDQEFIWMEEHYLPYDRWFENRIYPSPEGISIFFHDITDRKRLELQLKETNLRLQELTGYLQSSIEEERLRISRELHDDLGQTVSALRMDLAMLAKSILKSTDTQLRSLAEQDIPVMTGMIDAVVVAMRKIIRDLRPEAMDTLGVIGGLRWQVEEFERRTKIECTVVLPEIEFELEGRRSTALFRIVQESLTNILRHAKATRVDISLSVDPEVLLLRIHDNGVGITAIEQAKTHSFGLLGMRERLRAIDGSLEIAGNSGEGTTLTIRIPRMSKEVT